jgi:ubiquinone/menaquinone biosynthesis C-methylase UbiE
MPVAEGMGNISIKLETECHKTGYLKGIDMSSQRKRKCRGT